MPISILASAKLEKKKDNAFFKTHYQFLKSEFVSLNL